MGGDGGDAEAEIEVLIRARTFDRAATRALEVYGAELYGFLVSLVGHEPDAQEVFAQVGEDVWTGLPSFAFRCSMRTWLYVLARHAAARFRRSPWNHRGRRTGDSRLDDFLRETRSRTQPWLRTDVKDRFRALRESLDQDDRALLILRVDRGLSWKDVARVTLGDDVDDAALAREETRLTKRFQLLKEELRRRAKEAGLIDGDS
jgi:RNA polymerase sigma-70 factor (ECF subfamily)